MSQESSTIQSSNGDSHQAVSRCASVRPLAYTPPTIRTVDEYIIQEKIGEGTYGKVFKARDKATDQLVALKQIRIDNDKDGLPITAIREIKLLKSLKHENIVLLKEVVLDSPVDWVNGVESIYMVFEYMDHDLSGLAQCQQVNQVPGQIQCYIKQLLEGLYHCHKKRILHRDIKGANMLINKSGVLKLADFGLARKMKEHDSRYTNRVVTLWYRAPELLLGTTTYTPAIDMWSVGCILIELYKGTAAFPGTNETDQLQKIFEVCGTPTKENWADATNLPAYGTCAPKKVIPRKLREFMGNVEPETLDLIDKLLALDPKKRITAEQALDHDYFFKPQLTPDPKDLPKIQGSYHEMLTKKLRQEKLPVPANKRMRDNFGNSQPVGRPVGRNSVNGPPPRDRSKYPDPEIPGSGKREFGYRNPEYRPPPRVYSAPSVNGGNFSSANPPPGSGGAYSSARGGRGDRYRGPGPSYHNYNQQVPGANNNYPAGHYNGPNNRPPPRPQYPPPPEGNREPRDYPPRDAPSRAVGEKRKRE